MPEQKAVQSEWQRLCSLLTADSRLLEAVTHPASYFDENAETLRARGIHDVGQATPWVICIDWLERNNLLVELAPHESSLELQVDLDSLAIVRGQGVDLSALGTELVPLPDALAWADRLLNAAGLQLLRLEDGRDSYSLVVVWQASADEATQLAEHLGSRARALPRSGTVVFGKQLVVGSIGARIAAFALDLVFLAIVANIGVGVGALINGSTSSEGGVIFTTLGIVGGVYLIGLIVTVGLSGWTPGLLCLGLRIVREDTLMRAGIGRALGRGVLLLPVVFWPWWVLLLVTAVRDKSGRHQGLHDSLSRTMVLNVRRGLDPR
ncbi:RDD family protein [Agreia sp. PsM10]|uniref:RDD family protein n=1 Tax=Agreia sp. PsM10 TaxID=3030533 RepID=UPI00263AB900|nr:RDD family protein [Agreia sp. PsM10]MDN4640602.1 RDD family protein [Agreia sp. PsM10]